jgi:hypothetical protein
VRHALRSSGLVDVKASLSGVSQSGLKTSGGAMVDGARGIYRIGCVRGKLKTDWSMRGLRWTLLTYLYRFQCIRLYEYNSHLAFCLDLYI